MANKYTLKTRLKRCWKVLFGKPLRKKKIVPTNKVEGA
jgi:hypothetical protein